MNKRQEKGKRFLEAGLLSRAHVIFWEETRIEISIPIDRALRKILFLTLPKKGGKKGK